MSTGSSLPSYCGALVPGGGLKPAGAPGGGADYATASGRSNETSKNDGSEKTERARRSNISTFKVRCSRGHCRSPSRTRLKQSLAIRGA
jgi:hypothetical protein